MGHIGIFAIGWVITVLFAWWWHTEIARDGSSQFIVLSIWRGFCPEGVVCIPTTGINPHKEYIKGRGHMAEHSRLDLHGELVQ
jgi:hypothetical protein